MRPASPCSHLRDLTRTSESERHLKLDPEPTSEHADRIPVLRRLLPDAGRLLSYLRRIDACRTYSNWGPLASEFEARLAAHLDLPSGWVTSAVSGTGALVGDPRCDRTICGTSRHHHGFDVPSGARCIEGSTVPDRLPERNEEDDGHAKEAPSVAPESV